jgi:hypothetical protein
MMINMKRGAVLLAAACISGAVIAAPATKEGGNKVICRTMDETGSRLGSKRVCLTRDQWRQQKEAQRADLEKAQRIRTGQDIQ